MSAERQEKEVSEKLAVKHRAGARAGNGGTR